MEIELPFVTNHPGPNGRYSKNLYLDPDREIGRPALVGTPGLKDWSKPKANTEIRGFHRRGSTLYAVCGNKAYTISGSGTATEIGTLGTSTGPVWIKSNHSGEVMFVDGSSAYKYVGGTFSSQGVNCTPSCLSYLDSFFIVSASGSGTLYSSNVEDAGTWNPLNTANAEGSPDPIKAHLTVNRDLWVLSEESTEIFRTIGGDAFPCERIGGGYLHLGCIAPGSAVELDSSAWWLTDKINVVRSMGYDTPQVVSPPQLTDLFAGYAKQFGVADARAYALYWMGRPWYVITFPAASKTWVCDAMLTAAGLNGWFQWSSGLTGGRHRGISGIWFNGQWRIGDFENGKIGILDENEFTDYGSWIKSVRTCQAVQKTRVPIFHNSLELEMGEGVGTVSAAGLSTLSAGATAGDASIVITAASDVRVNFKIGITLDSDDVQWVQATLVVGNTVYLSEPLDGDAAIGNQVEWYNNMGEDPQAMLRWSDDRGKTWSNELWRSIGQAGQYKQRIRYNRLGQALDRTYEWSMTDPVKRIIYGAVLDGDLGVD